MRATFGALFVLAAALPLPGALGFVGAGTGIPVCLCVCVCTSSKREIFVHSSTPTQMLCGGGLALRPPHSVVNTIRSRADGRTHVVCLGCAGVVRQSSPRCCARVSAAGTGTP